LPRALELTPTTIRRFLRLSLVVQAGLALVTLETLVFSIRAAAAVPQIQRMIDAGVERVPLTDLPPRYQSRVLEDVLYLAVVVGWLVWQHRDHRLLRHAVGHTRFTPGWAVGWWFVPFANLVLPYKVVRDAASAGDERPAPGRGVIIAWWVCLVLPLATLPFFFSITFGDVDQTGISLADAKSLRSISALNGVLSVASGILAIVVVRSISNRTGRLLTSSPPPRDGSDP
jgi:hypothetical protein